MAMPMNLVMARHGQSDGNRLSAMMRSGELDVIPESVKSTHDWQYRLTEDGVEQARAARTWLNEEIAAIQPEILLAPGFTYFEEAGPPDVIPLFFDGFFASSHIRARETAGTISPAARWLVSHSIVERDWGTYNNFHPDERLVLFPETERMREVSRSRFRPEGGEQLLGEVRIRFRDWLGTLHRDFPNKNVLTVSHGETLSVAISELEHMLPEEFEQMHKTQERRLYNCDILWYTRQNPEDPTEVADFVRWMRHVRPTDIDDSPNGGDWVELPGKRYFRGTDLLGQVAKVEHLELPE